MLESQIDQLERKQVLRNDELVRRQQEPPTYAPDQRQPPEATSYHQHALSDAATPRGRFSAVDASYVVGSKPNISGAYPPASAAHQIELPPELPLGYAIDRMPELEVLSPTPQATPTSASGDVAPSRDLDVEHRDAGVGSLSHSGDLASAAPSTLPSGDVQRGVRSPRPFRRFR